MQLKKITVTLTIILTLLFFYLPEFIYAYQVESLTRAVQLFNENKFREAEPLFKSLLENDPNDFMLNYYYGATRTENGNFSEIELQTLLKSISEDTPVKVEFYLGIQYQAQSSWDQAIRHYNRFRFNTTVDEQESLELADKIQQCYNHENPFLSSQGTAKEEFNVNEETEDSAVPENVDAVNSQEATIEEIPEISAETNSDILSDTSDSTEQNSAENEGEPIEFRINSRITYLNTVNFRTPEGKNYFEEGTTKQKELNTSLKKMEELREEYKVVQTDSEKSSIGEKILTLENETYSLKEEITKLLLQAGNRESEYWQSASEEEIKKFLNEMKEYKSKETEETNTPEPEIAMPDSDILIASDILVGEPVESKLTVETEDKDELVYKIQIGAYSKRLPPYVDRQFKKLSLIRKIDTYTDDRGVVVYTTGNVTSLEDAVKLQKQVRQEGVEDAFVVPYFNGKRITLDQAKKIEKEL